MPRSKRPKDVRARRRAGGLVPMLVVLLEVMVVGGVVCCRFACVSVRLVAG